MLMQFVYRGHFVRQSANTGGKAGKGHNLTRSFRVTPIVFDRNCESRTFSYKLDDPNGVQGAINKCKAWVDKRISEGKAIDVAA